MTRRIIAAALLCLAALGAFAEAGDGAIIYGPEWAYLVTPPEGFKLDSQRLAKIGIQGLFYPSGQEAFAEDRLQMYINPFAKGGDSPEDLEGFIEWDLEYFRDRNPGLAVKRYKDLELGDFSPCRLYLLDDPERGYYMLHGYASEPGAIFVFVLVARGAEERSAFEGAYEDLLASFVYMDVE